MKRMLSTALAIAAALTLAMAAAPSFAQDAAKPAKKAPVAKSVKAGKGQKVCKTKLPDGKTKTWTCGADQPCCESHSLGLYTCGSQLLQCF